MSYTIYKTEAVIMRVVPRGEAHLDVIFFTRDFGKVTARIQSGRASHSKMRMHILRLNHVLVELVRGKHFWRCVGIQHHSSFVSSLIIPTHRIVRLAEFLIQGEDPHQEIFHFLKTIITFCEPVSPKGFEIFGVIFILQQLGYWDGEHFPSFPKTELIEFCYQSRKVLIPQINASISATQIMI